MSLLSWERGLKSTSGNEKFSNDKVAPLVGAWIEIISICPLSVLIIVAPLVGAWIEIAKVESLLVTSTVAPLVGAWIEISMH